MNEFLLRETTNEDLPTLLIVLQAAFEEYRGRLDPPSGAHNDTVEKIRQKLIQVRAVEGYTEPTYVILEKEV